MFKVEDLVRATKGTLLRGNLADAVKGISIDSRSIGRSFAFIAIKGDNFDGHDFVAQAIARGARAVIIKPSPATARLISSHPGISFIAVRDTVRALGDIASFHRARFNIPVICVTGSSGKTTVKEMVAHVLGLKFNVLKNEGTKNNHIGVPLTLLRISPRHKAVVLEIGTNHFGEVRNLASIARPNIGIITNIGPAHLGYFKTLAGVYIEKVTLLDCLDEPRIAVLNADDYFLSKRLPRRETRAFSLGFAIHKKSDFSASQIKLKTKSAEFVLNKRHRYILPNPGMQNIYNALSAITVARIFGLGHQDIAARLSDFILPPGRGEIIEKYKVKFIDDTYNSNPLSFAQALSTLKTLKVRGRKIVVMGDMLELGNLAKVLHEKLGVIIAGTCDTLITVGDLSRSAAEAAGKAGLNKDKVFISKTSVEARDILFNLVMPQKDDIILVKGSRAMKMEEVLK